MKWPNSYPNEGEVVQILLRDLIVAIIAYRVFGILGPLMVLATYLIGWIVNIIRHEVLHKVLTKVKNRL